MRAAIFTEHNGPMPVEDVTPMEPGPRDAIVHITASGVCHSDLHVISGALPMPPPAILGHEGCGVVEAVGSEVTRVRVGDRVIGSFIPRPTPRQASEIDQLADELIAIETDALPLAIDTP